MPDALNVGGTDYVCYFDAQICSDLSTSTNDCFTHTNSINASISDDDGETHTVTVTANSVSAKVCVSVTAQ